MGMDSVLVIVATGKGQCSRCRIQWHWWNRLDQVFENVQGIGIGTHNRGSTTHVRRREGGGVMIGRKMFGVFVEFVKDKGKG